MTGCATELGSSQESSFRDIDSSIAQLQHDLSMFPRSDPRRYKFVLSMATMRLRRHTLSNQREDLDETIVYSTESILLLPLSRRLKHGPFILDALFSLASLLIMRSKASKQPDDAIYASKYLFHIRDQPYEIPSTPHHKVTELLVHALALQVMLGAGNVMQNIREMAVLSRELFALEASDVETTHLLLLIYMAVELKLRPDVPDQPLDELIEFLRVARKHKPNLLECRIAIARSLAYRYHMTSREDDYEEAATILDEIITSTGSHWSTQCISVAKARALATGLAAILANLRSQAYETPENVEEAIYRTRTCFGSSSFNEHYPSPAFDLTEVAAEQRSHYFGPIEGSEALSSSSTLSQVPGLLEFRQTVDTMEGLLFTIREHNGTTKIDEAIEKGRTILASSSPNAYYYSVFGEILNEAFLCTNKIEYLNESISVRRQVTESPFPQTQRFAASPLLSRSLLHRSQFFPGYRTQDLDEALEILSQYVSTTHADLPDRFERACEWAYLARLYQHPSVSTAYETALLLMQDTPLFSPTLQLQHATLATYDTVIASLPLDYASYQLGHHRLEEAIETLERGRAILWSEMRDLRASINQIIEVDPDLGCKFAVVNHDLEELTKSVPPSHKLSMDEDSSADRLRAVDPFGRLVLKRRRLWEERAKLVSQIQALPGFNSFLTSPSFDTLRSAASSGPVIIINHSGWRSDILILVHNMPPSLIPTPMDFWWRACILKDKLLESRHKDGLDSSRYDKTLALVLAELYTIVGKPVIDQLRRLQVQEQSRIWWCPTSVFCSLPLHAMGPIPSDDGEQRYFSDLYICSYTPTLSALIQSRGLGSSSQSSDRPPILLVAQLDPSLPTVGGEIQVVQSLDTEVTSLISAAATPTTVIEGFHRHSFVHFACHGALEAGKPFEAGFELHRDARLSLLEIVRADLPAAEFAFLSACHTAEVTEGSIIDEGLHLAAAVQYCGFRSVVGTMWAMVDEDGRDLAKNFYKALFSTSGRDQELPYYERSAEALQFSVKMLRRKRGITLERWVNFVHYGA